MGWFQRVFLGSTTTFRNQNRNWIYLGFLVLVVLLVAAAKCAQLGHIPSLAVLLVP